MMKHLRIFAVLLLGLFPLALDAAEPRVYLYGTDFSHGAQHRYGANHYGRSQVNYVYAKPNGNESFMTARFRLDSVPAEKLFLTLEARSGTVACQVSLNVNETILFSGKDVFPASWERKRFEIPKDSWKVGENTITIANLENTGNSGDLPWFMMARCSIAGEGYQMPEATDDEKNQGFKVQLPSEVREFPEPLPPGKEPGFAIRGTKGAGWMPEQYLAEIPMLEKYKMNFLMICYTSLFVDQEGNWGNWYRLFESGDVNCDIFFDHSPLYIKMSDRDRAWDNAWWLPLPDDLKEKYMEVFNKAKAHNIQCCFSVHPQFASPRPLDVNSEKDIDDYYQHFAWAQKQGVQWFSVTLDDVHWGTRGPAVAGAEHVHLVNTVFSRLRKNDPEAQMIFCPIPYWGDGTPPEHRAYLGAIAEKLHKDVYVFWTGDGVADIKILSQTARSYKDIVKHRLIIWDNYPVNEFAPILHLGPITGRDADLGEICDGYMGNPMFMPNEANRIPLLTMADYAWNPHAYNPNRSIGQAIMHLAETPEQRETLKSLVELYPGWLFARQVALRRNSAMAQFETLLTSEDPHAARAFMESVETLAARLAKEFPGSYRETHRILQRDIRTMKDQLKQ